MIDSLAQDRSSIINHCRGLDGMEGKWIATDSLDLWWSEALSHSLVTWEEAVDPFIKEPKDVLGAFVY